MQITINVDDQTGGITVEADGREPYACESADECLDYLEGMLKGEEAAEEAGEGEAMPSGDMAEMWNDEAAKRPSNPNLMR